METVSKKINALQIVPAAGWNEAAARHLAEAMAADPLAGIESLRQSVQCGESQLFHVLYEDYCVGAFVLRVEQKQHGAEGIIVAGGGNLKGAHLLRLTIADIERRFIGCVSIRAHTARRGIVREFARFGYAPREVILAKAL